ncbi:hypothetical protein KIW84_015092 [Lathyrus oleraceus]|uniref:Uncharacterized protein n=1 Tax=Pisum sativum TaxID=3888 RepID=A0A9D5BPV6_PEA|nr:hypothetical protein KIW84_015092 [Pisum sativum]
MIGLILDDVDFKHLSIEDMNFLKAHLQIDEVEEVVWKSDMDKNPWPDGYSMGLFKACWDILKEDVFNFVNEFYHNARSMLTLEEVGLIKMAATGAQAAMVATQLKDVTEPSSYNDNHDSKKNNSRNSAHKNRNSYGRNNRRGQRGGRRGGGQPSLQANTSQWQSPPPPWQ